MMLSSSSAPLWRRRAGGALLVLAALALGACGRRGALEPPPGLTVAPKPAASERIVAPVAQVTTTDAASYDERADYLIEDPPTTEPRPVAVAPAPVDPSKPRKRFILDSLVE